MLYRLGIAVGHPDLIQVLNNTKAPYNIGTPSAQIAQEALSEQGVARMMDYRQRLILQRQHVIDTLRSVKGVGRILGGNDANFILVEILDNDKPCNVRAEKIYKHMAESMDVVVRFRGKEYGCEGCLRITIGTEEENKTMIDKLVESLATF
jgi:histidinol-phosphate aminotransferase